MSDDEDEYIFYGTPLPEIEDETILRKKAARELEVRDEKGRQRFHGAFTGGFSAGYFNTVGTKEGWAPSTFISSRSKVADRVQHNPEDFMDVEDFGEFGIATRKIHTTSNFHDTSVESRKRKFMELDSAIPGEAPLKDIVKPVRESIGIKILTKLGWKPGQGIGPRVKKQAGAIKVYGCSPFPSDSVTEEEDPLSLLFTFAPQDTAAEFFQPKDNVFGLGYSGLSKDSVLSAHVDVFNPTSTKSFLKKDKKKITISGQAFGVGAFEDDDDDIYSKDDMSQYDFSGLNSIDSQASKDKGYQSHTFLSDEVLKGFCKATQPPPIRKHYPAPELPPRYRPICSNLPKVSAPPAELKLTSRHNMSASDRSLLIGEKKFQPFQMTVKTKEIVKKTDSSDTLKIAMPNKSLSFRPFPNDEFKQKRYEDYLKLNSTGGIEKLIQPSSMTEWEKQQELEEFARAAVLFKPLSAALSAKFESKSHLNVEHEVMDALAKSRKENDQKAPREKRKLVGLSKRKTVEWHPASILCKRFNVPNPFPNSSEPASKTEKSRSLFDHISFQTRENDHSTEPLIPSSFIMPQEETSINTDESAKNDSNILALMSEEIAVLQNPPSENKRPPIDFFKDIFENSSSEDEDTSTTDSKTQPSNNVPESPLNSKNIEEEILEPTTTDPRSPKPKAISSNKKPGFGVFANLDLDALNQRTQVKKTIPQDSKDDDVEEIKIEAEQVASILPGNSSSLNDLYGPELPPDYSVSPVTNPDVHEKPYTVDLKKRSKHKVKHKHKHHKHKSKKKKKKKSTHKSSDESSFGSDEDIPPTVILDKLKKLQKLLKTDS